MYLNAEAERVNGPLDVFLFAWFYLPLNGGAMLCWLAFNYPSKSIQSEQITFP